jgi:rhodanese-related sulfurtransferase
MKEQFTRSGKLIICLVLMSFCHLNTFAQKSAMDLVNEAKNGIENLKPEKATEELLDVDVVLIDIREAEELHQGRIPGAVHAPRGMLEFYADSSLPYYKPEFSKEKRIILYCTSSGRSALAVQTLRNMGYTNVAHIDGGLKAWKAAGLPIEE